jgi:MFS family permease
MGKAEQSGGEFIALEAGAPTALPLPGVRQQPHSAMRLAPSLSQPRKGFRSVLRNRYFLRLWVAQLISQTIMNAANYGMIVLIATQSGSVFATGGAIAAFSLPAALFGAPAGVLVDRFDKRRVLWMSNLLRGLATFGFVVSLFINSRALLPVYLLTFFIALVGQFFAPAEGSAIPLLVHEDELVNALALFNITFTLSQALGIIVMGPLIVAGLQAFYVGTFFHQTIIIQPIHSLFLLVGVLFLVCALLTASIPRARLRNRAGQEHLRPLALEGERLLGIWAGITECWSFIRIRPMLLAAVLQLSLAGVVVAVMAEIAPKFVMEFFHQPAKLAALVFIPAGVGLILGAAALPHVIKRVRRQSKLVAIGVVTLVTSIVLLTITQFVAGHLLQGSWWQSWPYVGAVLLLTFVIGLALDLINIPAQTTMQAMSPDYVRGRVLALQMMLFNATTVPVVFLIGLAADQLGLPWAMNILAMAILVVGSATIVYAGRYRTVTDSRPIPAVMNGRASGQRARQGASPPLARANWTEPAGARSRPLAPRASDPVE